MMTRTRKSTVMTISNNGLLIQSRLLTRLKSANKHAARKQQMHDRTSSQVCPQSATCATCHIHALACQHAKRANGNRNDTTQQLHTASVGSDSTFKQPKMVEKKPTRIHKTKTTWRDFLKMPERQLFR